MSSAVGVRGVAEVTSDTTVAASDYLILVYSSNGPISVTLPTAGLDMAFGYRIIDADGQSETNNITVKAEGGEPINRGGSDVGDPTLSQNDGVWDFDPQKKAGGGNAEWTFGIVVQDHGQLQGVTADQHHAQDHWSRHKQGNADEGKVEELATASTTAGEVPQAGGSGGLAMGRIDHDSDIDNISEGDHRTTEQVEDIVGALIAAASGSNISVTYDDAGDALTIDTSALNEEEVEDVVNGLLATDSNLTLTYDDAGNTLTIGLASSITVEVLNNDEEPNLDISEAYSEPFSQGFRFPRIAFTELDAFNQNTSGSGAINAQPNNGQTEFKSGTTDGSSAKATYKLSQARLLGWDKDRRLHFTAFFSDDQGPLFIGTGRVGEDNYTNEHVGFKMDGGNLELSVADGTTESTSTVQSTPTTGQYVDLYLEFISGTDAKAWIDKDPNSNSADATVSSNLPSGSSFVGEIYTIQAENASATNRTIFGVYANGAQQP